MINQISIPIRRAPAAFLAAALVLLLPGLGTAQGNPPEQQDRTSVQPESLQSTQGPEQLRTAVFAGGCFWGVEGVFEHLRGVHRAVSGYAGGEARMANYNAVSRGVTEHAEAVLVEYDPQVISYQELLDVFFQVAHNPTQLNYQGPDRGTQYRSEIFTLSEDQERMASRAITDLELSGAFESPIVTALSMLESPEEFYPAEEYHQDFMRKNPEYPYVVYWDWPKIDHLRQAFPDLFLDVRWR